MVFGPWNPCRTTDQLSAASLDSELAGHMRSWTLVDEPWFISELWGFSPWFRYLASLAQPPKRKRPKVTNFITKWPMLSWEVTRRRGRVAANLPPLPTTCSCWIQNFAIQLDMKEETWRNHFGVCIPDFSSMEHENQPLKKGDSVGNHHFQGSMLSFGGISWVLLKNWFSVDSEDPSFKKILANLQGISLYTPVN